MKPIMQGWFDTIRPQCERVRSVLCARWLSPEPTDHVRYRTCADGTVRPPQPSTGPGAWTLLTGALRRVSGVVSSQCVCGPTSKVAQARPREAPRVPARYTLCVRTRREAAHGQGKRPRACSKSAHKLCCVCDMSSEANWFALAATMRDVRGLSRERGVTRAD